EELTAESGHVDKSPVGADDDVAATLVGHREGGNGGDGVPATSGRRAIRAQRAAVGALTSATPMRASRVMSGTRSTSDKESALAGRAGSTMYRISALESQTRSSREGATSRPSSLSSLRGSLTARDR